MAFMRAAREGRSPAGNNPRIPVGRQTIALANVDGKFHAINNVCFHRGGPLGEGELEGTVVICPWHGWQYDVTTGKLVTNPAVGVLCYPVEVRGEDVFVDVG